MDLQKMIAELYAEKERMDRVIASLEEFLSGTARQPSPGRSRRGRKSMSAKNIRKYQNDEEIPDKTTARQVTPARQKGSGTALPKPLSECWKDCPATASTGSIAIEDGEFDPGSEDARLLQSLGVKLPEDGDS
jgi:hypothetical protein